jgi:hypothetical protein
MSPPAIATTAESSVDPRGAKLLYLLLPLHHEAFDVGLAEAGLLLAANRLVPAADL